MKILLLLFFFSQILISANISGYKKNILNEKENFQKNKVRSVKIFSSDSIYNESNEILVESMIYNIQGELEVDSVFSMKEDEDKIPYYKYYYTENGDIHKYEMFGFDSYPITHEYVYDSNDGKPSGSSVDGAEPRRYTYEFDKKGNLTLKEGYTFYPSGDMDEDAQRPWVKIEIEVYHYDKKGNLIKTEFQRRNYESEKEEWKTEYSINKYYDKKNLLIKEENINSNKEIYLTKKYTYDKNGLIKLLSIKPKFDPDMFLHYFYEKYDK